jgi:Sulfotransferase family
VLVSPLPAAGYSSHIALRFDADVLMAMHVKSLLPRKQFRILEEAFLGTRTARARHARYLGGPVTIEAAVNVICQRWPGVIRGECSEPVFILSGGWRSGSTFLQRWLMASADILIWGEPYRYAEPIRLLARQVRAFADASWPLGFFFADQYQSNVDFTQEFVANLYPSMQEFVNAHLAYFDRLFIQPCRRFNKTRWGSKEIGLTTDDAHYLRWLFPKARLLFLYRSPYHGYRSYRQWRDWYSSWPDEPVFTASSFGRYWKHLTGDFVSNHEKVDGLLLKYEKLQAPDTRKRLEDYLHMPIIDAADLPRVRDRFHRDVKGSDNRWVPGIEFLLLRRAVEPLASQLGYAEP